MNGNQARNRMLDILYETVQYYTKNPRGFSACGCVYLTGDDRMCAVGRCLSCPKDFADSPGNVLDTWESSEKLDASLKEEYRGLSIQFWAALQGLHDDCKNWKDPEGLTERGEGAEYMIRHLIYSGAFYLPEHAEQEVGS